MSAWRKQIKNYKSISWLLVAAMLLVTVLPAHYHLHHLVSDTSAAHSHATDSHLSTDKLAQSHHNDGAIIINAAPNGLLSKWDGEINKLDITPLVTLVSFLALFSFLNIKLNSRPNQATAFYKQIFYRLSPPLRAPPLN
ncbi:MAG: hypothetical protein ACC635_04160 [Acidiferrobacterales bacterium]